MSNIPEFWSWDRYREFISTVPAPQEDCDFFFASPPPCAQSYLRGSASSPYSYKPIPFLSRYKKGDSSDIFFHTTIKTKDTVPHLLTLIRTDLLRSQSFSIGDATEEESDSNLANFPHMVVLAHLGPGTNGFHNTAHGGLLASLIDESMGCCAEAFRPPAGTHPAGLYTANLNISYRAPVSTPGVVIIKLWVTRNIGRKWFLRALVLDQDGKTLVEAEALWVEVARKPSL